MVAGIPFVYEREEREGRLVGPTATGLGVDVVEKLAREVEIVPEGTIVEEHKLLVFLHLNYAVAVDAAGTPGDVPRYEKVRRQVDAVADAGVQEVVELCHLLGADRRAVLPVAEFALIVVDSQCVVAEARKTRRKFLGVGRAHVVRGEAEVDAVEALLDAWHPRELKMVALANDAPVLPGGRIDPSCGGKVER